MPFLFSYGTLQQEDVELSTFGMRLAGWQDQLENFEQSLVLIEDEDELAAADEYEVAAYRRVAASLLSRSRKPCGAPS